MPYIGIDFGTSNSVVANFQFGQADVVPNHEGQKWTPSVVTLRRDNTLAFGQEAKENFDEQRSIRSIKRILGTPERVPLVGQNLRTEQIAVMLFSLLKKDAEQQLGESFTKGVVTIPAVVAGVGFASSRVSQMAAVPTSASTIPTASTTGIRRVAGGAGDVAGSGARGVRGVAGRPVPTVEGIPRGESGTAMVGAS